MAFITIEKDKGWCWVVAVSVFLNLFASESLINCFGILYPRLLEQMQQDNIKVSIMAALCVGVHFLSCLISVKVCNLTNVSVCCTVGSIISGISLITISFSNSFSSWIVLYSFLHGVGSGLIYGPSAVIVSKWFVKHRSEVNGVVMSALPCSGLVVTQIVQFSITHYPFYIVIRWFGIFYLLVTMFASLTYIPLDIAQTNCTDNEEIAFVISGDIFKNKKYLIWVLIMILTWCVYFVPSLFLVKYATLLRIETKYGSWLVTLLYGADFLSRIIIGKILQIIERHMLNIYQGTLILLAVIYFATFFANKYWMLCVFSIAYGFLNGSYVSLMPLMTLKVCGNKDFAQGWGIMNGSLAIPASIGPPLVGLLYSTRSIESHYMFIMSALPFLIGSLLMVVLKRSIERSESDSQDEDAGRVSSPNDDLK